MHSDSKKPTWIDVKKSIKDTEGSHLIELVKELYQLSDENKNFLHARFLRGTASLKKYRKIILESLYLDVMDDNDNFNFEKADNAVKTYVNSKTSRKNNEIR